MIQVLDCNNDQEKVIKTDESCEKIFCQCIPPERCSPLNYTAPEEHLVPEEISNGCCTKLNWVCKKESCPPPPKCQDYYTAIETEVVGKCCPTFECVPPKECIVELFHTASPIGGEVAKPEIDRKTTLKKVNVKIFNKK